jgi:RNA polymerase sigma factor (sigma-70 family)
MDLDTLYRTYKPLLLSVAYRMLGSLTEAEDAVQDVFVTLRRINTATIDHPKAYMVKMITNRSLNMLKAAHRTRELYPGTWLPEPQISMASEEPSEQIIRRESFGYAMLVLLQELTPPERAVFILRESIGYEYGEIAELLDKSETACRKIYSRAKAKIGRGPHIEDKNLQLAEPFIQAFAKAVEQGQFEPFIKLLTEDAVLLSDGGGKVRAALLPILGKERILAFFEGIHAKGSLQGELRPVWISGQQGIWLVRSNLPPIAICFGPDPGNKQIRTVYIISNPDKLTHISV